MPDRDRVTQTSAYLRMLLLRPGEYRTRWERLAAQVEPGKIDTAAVAEVLAGSQTDGVDLADTARRALDGTVLTTDTLGRFIEAFEVGSRHATRLWDLDLGAVGRTIEGDGDQVLLAYSPRPVPDPPVYYYAHAAGRNTARKLAPSVSEWIESLPKSPLFRK